MMLLLFFSNLFIALPLAVVAFYMGNFAVLTGISVYVTAISLVLCVAAMRGTTGGSDLDEF